MDFGNIITAGALSILIVEGLKWLIRKIKKNPDFTFSAAFYALVIPVLNAVMPFVLVLIGLFSDDPILSMGWIPAIQYLVQIFLASLITFLGYNGAIKPLKDYSKLKG